MGSSESSLDKGILNFIKTEFSRAKTDPSRDYLTLRECLTLLTPENCQFSLKHIGVIFILDGDKDGRITMGDIMEFAEFCNKNLRNSKSFEIQGQIQALSMILLLELLRTEEGENDAVAWVGRLLYEDDEVIYLENKEQIPYLKLNCVKSLYELTQVKDMYDIQGFIDMLQMASEEKGLMNLEMEELDEYVPLEICQYFVKEFFKGIVKLMKDVCID